MKFCREIRIYSKQGSYTERIPYPVWFVLLVTTLPVVLFFHTRGRGLGRTFDFAFQPDGFIFWMLVAVYWSSLALAFWIVSLF